MGAGEQRTSFPQRGKLVARAAVTLTALAAAVGLFVVLAGSGDDTASSATTTQPQGVQKTTGSESPVRPATTQPPGASGTGKGQATTPTRPTIERVVVRRGKLVGGVRRLAYEKGERVRFSVRSDVRDEVHIHGFEITRDLPANRSVQFQFLADIEGVFEVELHDAHVTIAELRISP